MLPYRKGLQTFRYIRCIHISYKPGTSTLPRQRDQIISTGLGQNLGYSALIAANERLRSHRLVPSWGVTSDRQQVVRLDFQVIDIVCVKA